MGEENVSYGTENLEVGLKFACGITNDVVASLKDGKITFTDAPRFVDDLFALPGLFRSAGGIDEEVIDMDAEEAAKMKALIMEELELDADAEDVEEIAADAFAIVVNGVKMTKSVMDLVAKIKARKK